MARRLLSRLKKAIDECLKRGGVVVAVLPTGYGKTSFVRHHLLDKVAEGLRIVHVLPLRAIVRETAKDAIREAVRLGLPGDIVGYQAGIEVEGVNKSPYLARNYMIVTIDSFVLSFYGVPVYEVFRDAWHSDVAYALARSFNLLILDEYHLMVSGDAEDRGEAELLAKQASVVADVIRDYLRDGRCVAVFTATLPPSLLEAVADRLGMRGVRVWLVGYGDSGSGIYQRLSAILGGLGEASISVERDEDFERERCGCIDTMLVAVGEPRDGVLDLDAVLDKLGDAKSVFLAFNSWRRAVATYKAYRDKLRERIGCEPLLLTGKMGPLQRESVFKRLEGLRSVCLFATQVVEAGVNLDFDVLVSEAAPLPALIQRAGRVARNRRPGPGNRIIILYVDNAEDMLARGIYDGDVVRETLRLLRDALGGDGGRLDWRCMSSDCPSVWSLLAQLDPVYASRVPREAGDRVPHVLSMLSTLALPPRQALSKLDEALGGSFIRKSALIPLAPPIVTVNDRKVEIEKLNGQEAEEGIVSRIVASSIAVDAGFIERYGEAYLDAASEGCGRGKCVKAILARREEKRFKLSIDTSVALEDLYSRPLTSMWRLSRRGMLLGFLLKPGVYDEELGLLP